MRREPERFAHIHRAERNWRTAEEWVPVAEEFAREHGCLPSKRRLNANGYMGLRGAKDRYPRLFAHIKQHEKGRTPEEWVSIACHLAARFGKLPNYAWLEQHGHGGLLHARRNHAHLFTGIEQERKGRKPHEWMPVTEALAAQHGGLPSTTWLNRHGFNPLVQARSKHRHLFAHIARRREPL